MAQVTNNEPLLRQTRSKMKVVDSGSICRACREFEQRASEPFALCLLVVSGESTQLSLSLLLCVWLSLSFSHFRLMAG